MAGLYEGLEEVGFKPLAEGYVFQTNNRWLLGPGRRYLVTEAQKVEIAARIRETLKFLKPFALTGAVLIPLALVAGIFWLISLGVTLTVIETHANETRTYTQSVGLTGSTGTLWSGNSHLEFHVSSFPGDLATVTVTGFDLNGKPGTSSKITFGSDGATLNLTDDGQQAVASAHLSVRAGPASPTVAIEAAALALALFIPYLAFMHVYSMRRLEPLLAGLPRSNSRIGMSEGTERFAAKVSVKLLVVMIGGTVLPLAGTLTNMITAIVEHHPINAGISALAAVMFGGVTAYYLYLAFLKLKARKAAAVS
jgi:hypothetical protein